LDIGKSSRQTQLSWHVFWIWTIFPETSLLHHLPDFVSLCVNRSEQWWRRKLLLSKCVLQNWTYWTNCRVVSGIVLYWTSTKIQNWTKTGVRMSNRSTMDGETKKKS
jgi:hypothetical protein